MVAALDQVYRYRIDPDDRIAWVDARWLAFAQENGAPELTGDVVGQSLWRYIAGDATCEVYRRLHSEVRLRRRPIVVPFRCDSPSLRREMQLVVSSDERGEIHYESTILLAAPCPPTNVFDASLSRGRSLLTMCSCCKRVLLEPEGWLEIDEASVRLEVLNAATPPQLRYEVCPGCIPL